MNYGRFCNCASGNTFPADQPVGLDVAERRGAVLPLDVVEGAVPVEQVLRVLAYLRVEVV